jgi:GTP-binding protein YchF
VVKAGIVGLPNVGKSTLFNALTRTHKAETANYPFCTIEPNVGVVSVPDPRLDVLAQLVRPRQVVPAVVELVDIAGLVKDAYKGEGLGNQFLANIREVDAVVHVLRCFDDGDVLHTMGSVDPLRDIEVVGTELILADLQSIDNRCEHVQKRAKSGNVEDLALLSFLRRAHDHLNEGRPVRSLAVGVEEKNLPNKAGLLTVKPVLYACNVSEKDLADPTSNPYVQTVRDWIQANDGGSHCVLSAKLEAELSDLPINEVNSFLRAMGVSDSGVSELIRATYRLLDLSSFFTAGEKEVRAWTFPDGARAPECAGVIHTDFQRGFVKAEVIAYEDFVRHGGHVGARKEGKMRLEGRDYVFRDGDIAIFKFNA